MRLRQALESDCALLFGWANDRDTRQCSIYSAPIAWETHVAWFHNKLNDPACLLLLAENEQNTAIGQIRFDVCGSDALVSISLDAGQRGRGYGTQIIRLGAEFLLERVSVDTIHAWIKPDNFASQRAFERAGFCNQGLQQNEHLSMLHFTFEIHLTSQQ